MADRRIRRRKTPARDQLRIRNGLSIIPSLFTIGNIFCGYYALLAAYNADYDTAAKAIGFGVLLDGLDGRIARLTKTSSDFGVQLDSLADFLTFGAAPAMLAFRWAFAIKGIGGEVVLLALRFCSLTTFAFVVSGALRLARFNIQSQKPPDATAKRHFVGLPIPAGAGLIAAIVHFLKDPILQVGSSLLWSLLVLLAAILMISTVRYPSFKELNVMKYGARFVYLAAAMAIYLLFYYSEYVLLVLAVAYVSSGPIAKLVHVVRRFLAGAATAETVHEAMHENLKS